MKKTLPRKVLLLGCAAWMGLGMVCVGPDGAAPGLPPVVLKDIHLTLSDPEAGRAAAALSWDWPAGEKATYFEVYQAFRPDSLGAEVLVRPAPESTSALVLLPEGDRPLTLYYGIRAVLVEPTGQKRFGTAVPVDSLVVRQSLEILSPAPRTYRSGRRLEVEVKTSSDNGIVLRQLLFEKARSGWKRSLDTCLPMLACGQPVFGTSVQLDAPTLQAVAPGDTLETLYCVEGNESFEDQRTGRNQGLDCARFFRTGG